MIDRKIVLRLFTDGLITEEELDRLLASLEIGTGKPEPNHV